MSLIYATDLDRTIIFSNNFITEYKPKGDYEVIEREWEREISYISSDVKNKIVELSKREDLEVIPVTSRSLTEYKRVELGLNNKYAIVANGGIILENGKPMEEWEEYIKKNVKLYDLLSISIELSSLSSVVRKVDIIDGRYLFTKVNDTDKFDIEVERLIKGNYDVTITRQKKKVYIIPNTFSKAIALRWLQNKLGIEKIVASGDSQLDLPMLAIADYAVIPKHGALIKEGYVTDGRIIGAGIESSIETMELVEKVINKEI